MKRFIYVLVVILCLNSICFANFNDIDNHWAKEQIMRFANNEYINGYEDNSFKPNNNVKYNEFIKILVKIVDDNILDNSNDWDKPYIEYAKSISLISNNEVDFEKYMTRQEVVNMLYNFLIYYNCIDKEDISEVEFLVDNDILHGYTDGTLRLENNITRAEALTLIIRTIDYRNKCIYSMQCTVDVFKEKDICKYTNYKGKNDLFLNTYNIENGIIYYSDLGRYGNFNNISYSIYNDLIIDILLNLIGKEQYVLSTYLIDSKSVVICYGNKDIYVDNGSTLFDLMFFEQEKQYKDFDYNVKVEIHRLWKELNEIKSGVLYNRFYLEKLEKCLVLICGYEDANIIINTLKSEENFIVSNKFVFVRQGSNITIYINK